MQNIEKKKIALIGGAGFIGHNLALALKKRGHVPVIFDSLAVNNVLSFTDVDINIKNRKLYRNILNQRIDLLHDSQIEINVEDARDYSALSRILGLFIKPDIIIHLAAVAHANKANRPLSRSTTVAVGGHKQDLQAHWRPLEVHVFFSPNMRSKALFKC